MKARANGSISSRLRLMRLSLLLGSLLVTTVAEAAAGAAGVARKPPAPGAKNGEALVSVSGMTAADYAQCVGDLAASKVVFEKPDAVTQQGCRLSGAVRLTSVATPFGDVGFSGKPTMLCGFARQFSGWVREIAAPLTLGYTGQRLTQVETGSGFVCKARYDKPGAVPSEHAKGDAIDIASFILADKRRIPVKQQSADNAPANDLVHALRMSACGYFTTVLGPGADAAHEAHLHFDSGVHDATPNYRICE